VSVTYEHPRPALTTDVALFTVADRELQILLIRRKKAPFQGLWALLGGFLDESEDLDACARRELAEETGVTGAHLHPLANFSRPGRDPRGWTVSAAYVGLIETAEPSAGDDAAEAGWHPVASLPKLAFDHAEIVATALEWLGRQGPEQGLDVAAPLPSSPTKG
jgi:8-oxo-dGTP diphosphatase